MDSSGIVGERSAALAIFDSQLTTRITNANSAQNQYLCDFIDWLNIIGHSFLLYHQCGQKERALNLRNYQSTKKVTRIPPASSTSNEQRHCILWVLSPPSQHMPLNPIVIG